MKRTRSDSFDSSTNEASEIGVLSIHRNVWNNIIAKMLDLKSLISLSKTCKTLKEALSSCKTQRKERILKIRRIYKLKKWDYDETDVFETQGLISEGADLDDHIMSPFEEKFISYALAYVYHRDDRFYDLLSRFDQFSDQEWPRRRAVFNTLCGRFEMLSKLIWFVGRELPNSPEDEVSKQYLLFERVECSEFDVFEAERASDHDLDDADSIVFDLSIKEDREMFC